MQTKVEYEWTIEEIDAESGDIIDSSFSDDLNFWTKEDWDGKDLGLVRNEGNEDDGLEDRYWAYVKDGKLPEFFTDSMGEFTGIKVPQKFHLQLSSYFKKQVA